MYKRKAKERGEPSKIYHVRNAMGIETLIRCGRVNEHFIERIK